MFDYVRALPGAVQRPLRAALALAAAAAGLAVAGEPAAAATHDYCNWDGSYNVLAGGSTCFQSGENQLTNNFAYLPYAPTGLLIFCSANQNGVQYAGWTSGGTSCNHPYGGGNLLKAKEMVSSTATTHGVITY